jgi:hypothetical protein
MRKEESDKLNEVIEAISNFKVDITKDIGEVKIDVKGLQDDIKYVKEHVGVMNDELGVCVERIGKLEKCRAVEVGKEKQRKYDWKMIFGVSGATAAFITAIYYFLIIVKII